MQIGPTSLLRISWTQFRRPWFSTKRISCFFNNIKIFYFILFHCVNHNWLRNIIYQINIFFYFFINNIINIYIGNFWPLHWGFSWFSRNKYFFNFLRFFRNFIFLHLTLLSMFFSYIKHHIKFLWLWFEYTFPLRLVN